MLAVKDMSVQWLLCETDVTPPFYKFDGETFVSCLKLLEYAFTFLQMSHLLEY
jgi:hypothetical protein